MPTYKFPPLAEMAIDFNTPDGIQEEGIAIPSFGPLLAIMCEPHDEERRSRFVHAVHAQAMTPAIETEGEISASIPAEHVAWLMAAPDMSSKLREMLDGSVFSGTLAGIVLGWCLFRYRRPDTAASASLGAACRAIDEAAAKNGWRGGGIENMKKHIWPRFRPVAHLWAAFHIMSDRGETEALIGCDIRAMEHFVLISEWLREEGETFRPKNARATDTLLRPDKTWKVDRAAWGDNWPPVRIECADLSTWDPKVRFRRKGN